MLPSIFLSLNFGGKMTACRQEWLKKPQIPPKNNLKKLGVSLDFPFIWHVQLCELVNLYQGLFVVFSFIQMLSFQQVLVDSCNGVLV